MAAPSQASCCVFSSPFCFGAACVDCRGTTQRRPRVSSVRVGRGLTLLLLSLGAVGATPCDRCRLLRVASDGDHPPQAIAPPNVRSPSFHVKHSPLLERVT